MKLDIEEIRQSPTAFVDLETVILLSDRVMELEMKRDELAAQNAMLREALVAMVAYARADGCGLRMADEALEKSN